MEPDFQGWATKAGLKCTDGRTIMRDAFAHQASLKVPLVWMHGHTDPENILGHAILEPRDEGVWAYGFFNESPKAKHMKHAVDHKDINMMSIWANQLKEQGKQVFHGVIREVSLVLSGANPGAMIEHVSIRHSEDDVEELEDEAIIYTGLELELKHSDESNNGDVVSGSDEPTIQDVVDSMTEEQQDVLHFMVGEALTASNGSSDSAQHGDKDGILHGADATIQDVYNAMTEEQKTVLHYMVGEALASAGDSAQHSDADTGNMEGIDMTKNVFENTDEAGTGTSLSHDDMKAVITAGERGGSLKQAVLDYGLQHNITDIDILFPDAVALDATPEWLSRRVEWVGSLLAATRKSPFSRIKTISADITYEDARAKGYVKGDLKKEEFFGVTKRVTTPSTIYKKQALDRDDVVDITDFDVVVWLKGEMRLMLDEEIARAILIGDGRDFSHEDKINEQNIRPIAKDHELYVTTVNVNLDDASSTVMEVVDALILNRKYYKGSGLPNYYTSETYISKFMLLKDTLGRRLYKNLQEVADDLRVSAIIPVEVMEEDPTIVGILVNPIDYVVGATAGGQVSMFDDFDIDYNKQKYLIETRLCGALTKLKSAIVVKKVASNLVDVTPTEPTFNPATGALTIVNQTGVVYKNSANATINAAGSPYVVAAGDSYIVNATPASGYYFPSSEADSWIFTADA